MRGNSMAEGDTPVRADRRLLAIGIVVAAGGFYFMLVGVSLAPPPGHSDAPGWVALCCGLAFFSAGAAVLVRGFLGLSDKVQELPADTPMVFKTIYWLSGVVAAASLAGIGTWVAFGPGARHFAVSGLIGGPIGDGLGRTMFGIGAILSWLIVVLLAHASAKKIFGRKS
jgi:hypothetical protein